ncbi:DUF5133 domain-containing protein [Streptomyces sp. NPDC057428]|uniref:DUF5133 domain-containing protein n=1 Tax=Streptomyces sp. NPDC057428 TaxID=3346129 RepID=UPI003688D1CB
MSDVACTLCLFTGIRDVESAPAAARHRLRGARTEADFPASRPDGARGPQAWHDGSALNPP